jgi:histidine triad (HIT) family protein
MSCVFCQIVKGTKPGDILFHDSRVMVFRDIQPQAPVHLLIIPKKHISSVTRLTEEDEDLLSHMMATAIEIAKREGLWGDGFRLVINSGKQGGQLVPHLHLHLLGGKQLSGQLG